ncbi:PLP-dependent transferase [Colletotrichum zoysiae]|uniref:PLP-dependent transferase n=1 Tax=Colletotrichum zoysiae TaxID=1216348 RepID=A0AAD9M0J4_9PEZI|nr:PLP-dependent transferase [Colletotrichum zoysiae]
MSLPIPPPLGCPVPNVAHAVSVQLPKWQDMVDFASGQERIRSVQQSGYPRSFLHPYIRKLHAACASTLAGPDHACLLFLSPKDAVDCKEYMIQSRKPEDIQEGHWDEANIRVQPLEMGLEVEPGHVTPMKLYAILFPTAALSLTMIFWRLTGSGISSRMAEDLLKNPQATSILEIKADVDMLPPPHWLRPVQGEQSSKTIRERIAWLLERAPVGGPRSPAVEASDIFLYPTGMSAIYNLTRALRTWPGEKTVVFGFPYELTLKAQQEFSGKGCIFYGFGTAAEMDLLEDYLHMLAQQDRGIQAVWCECASNPLLRTVDLDRLRRLADRYGFLVVVDDTIGSFANVDVLGVADVVVTSLTKSFSGYADVMAGSVALNPRSPSYVPLRQAIDSAGYVDRLYWRDAVCLEANSRGFLDRAAQMNSNAEALVGLLGGFAAHKGYPLRRIYYPSTCVWSAPNYEARMRPATADFNPGYGGLFTLQFDDVAASAAFFDALRVCKGPSLGANVTLAQPYVQTVFGREKAWAARYGLSETIVRISVGIEDTEALMEAFREAIDATTSAHVDLAERDGYLPGVRSRYAGARSTGTLSGLPGVNS